MSEALASQCFRKMGTVSASREAAVPLALPACFRGCDNGEGAKMQIADISTFRRTSKLPGTEPDLLVRAPMPPRPRASSYAFHAFGFQIAFKCFGVFLCSLMESHLVRRVLKQAKEDAAKAKSHTRAGRMTQNRACLHGTVSCVCDASTR